MALPLLQCLVRKKYEAFVLLLIVYIVSSWYCFHRSKDGLLFSGPTDLSLLTSSMMMMMNSSRYKNQSNNSYYYYNYYNYYYNYWQSSKQTKSRKPLLPSFREGRSKRFPSIEERVKVYMGHWYLPPCDKADAVYYSYSQYKNNRSEQTVVTLTKGNELVHRLGTSAASRKPFFAKQSDFENCNEKYKHDKRIRHECLDVRETIPRSLLWKETTAKTIAINPDKMMNDTMVANDDDDDNKKTPIVLRFGDDSDMQRIPTIQKWKPALSSEELANLTTGNCSRHDVLSQPLPPVVWLLNSKRHYRFVHNVADADTLWELKKNRAIFRGGLTGFGRYPNLTNEDRCDLCTLVLRYANSSLVDAKLTSTLRRLNSSVVNGINLVGKKVSLGEQLQYKAVIFLEGNDVSSGLKWGLLSRSVVLMPPPTKITWAMEELLQPYVHYIPLYPNLSNVEEQVIWILQHDEEAQAIAHQGSLWIQDLVLHPNASLDNRIIQQEMLVRYRAHFQPQQQQQQQVQEQVQTNTTITTTTTA